MIRCTPVALFLFSAGLPAQVTLERLAELRQTRDAEAIEAALLPKLEADPKDPLAMLGLAEVYASEGPKKKLKEARKLLEQLVARTDSAKLDALSHRVGGFRRLVRSYLRQLEDGEKLWIVTDPKRMKREMGALDRKAVAFSRSAKQRAKRIAKLEDQLEAERGKLQKRSVQAKIKKLEKELGKARAKWLDLQAKRADAVADSCLLAGNLMPHESAVAPTAIDRGLVWLAAQQEKDGRFRGPKKVTDIGVTGICLLALLGDPSNLKSGRFDGVIDKAIRFLRVQQDKKDGCFGAKSGRQFMYCHAIATQALIEAMRLRKIDDLRIPVQRGLDFIARSRNPGAAWRYYPRDTDNDTSITGWMAMALTAGRDAGLKPDPDAISGALKWIEGVTDPDDGSAGYTKPFEGSSRTMDLVEAFPPSKTRAITAMGLLVRLRVGEATKPVHKLASDCMLAVPPRWGDDGSIDFYYWMIGTQALAQLGGDSWDRWRGAIFTALLDHQRGNGSWPAAGVWGTEGGEKYATAFALLALQTASRRSCLMLGR